MEQTEFDIKISVKKKIIKMLKSKEYHSPFIDVDFSDAIKIIENMEV